MADYLEAKNELISLAKSYKERFDLSNTVEDDYFEPGMMENLDQYYGSYDVSTNIVYMRTEVKGLRYENRTTRLSKMSVGEELSIVRDRENIYNYNNFKIYNSKNEDVGTLSAELCNALAPLYDMGYASVIESKSSYIEKIYERSRYAKQGILFIELKIKLKGI